MTLPDVTLMIGPGTRASLAVNAEARRLRAPLEARGMGAAPLRLAGPAAWKLASEDASDDERLAGLGGLRPVLLVALGFLGSTAHALANRELFPNLGRSLSGLAKAPVTPRIVISIEPLHTFFARSESEVLARRVSATGWEHLYEISWADIVGDLRAMLPEHEVCVLTPDAAMFRASEVSEHLFGANADLVNADVLRAAHLTEEGRARLRETGGDPHALKELVQEFGNGPDPARLEETFGIDALTATLLANRFEEDLVAISAMTDVRLW